MWKSVRDAWCPARRWLKMFGPFTFEISLQLLRGCAVYSSKSLTFSKEQYFHIFAFSNCFYLTCMLVIYSSCLLDIRAHVLQMIFFVLFLFFFSFKCLIHPDRSLRNVCFRSGIDWCNSEGMDFHLCNQQWWFDLILIAKMFFDVWNTTHYYLNGIQFMAWLCCN